MEPRIFKVYTFLSKLITSTWYRLCVVLFWEREGGNTPYVKLMQDTYRVVNWTNYLFSNMFHGNLLGSPINKKY